MDELSHFTGATQLTVNIRGNDIDFKVLCLQMSLVLSFPFFLLRKKKNEAVSRFDLHIPSSASLFLKPGNESVLRCTSGGHPAPELIRQESDVAPLSLWSHVPHAGEERQAQRILSLPPTIPSSSGTARSPQRLGESSWAPKTNGPYPKPSPAPPSRPQVCLQLASSPPLSPPPLTRLLPSCSPATSSPSLSHVPSRKPHHHYLSPVSITFSCRHPNTCSLQYPPLSGHWPHDLPDVLPQISALTQGYSFREARIPASYSWILQTLALLLGFSVNIS